MQAPSSNPVALWVVLGDQLFPLEQVPVPRAVPAFMAETFELCTRVRHHQQKLVLFLAAMRSYRDTLATHGREVEYRELAAQPAITSEPSYEDELLEVCRRKRTTTLVHFEIDDRFMEERLGAFASRHGLARRVLPTPKFLCGAAELAAYFGRAAQPRMADFYRRERRRLGLLVDARGEPQGGRWSHDAQNRRRLPRGVTPPAPSAGTADPHVAVVRDLVRRRFGHHPGSADDFEWPTTRAQALRKLDEFVGQRLACFGHYEDAITARSATVFHSLLSPALNLGLVTPQEVVARVMSHAAAHDIPLNSLEGFVRQVIGWREFVRGIYRHHDARQSTANFFGHERLLTAHWYDGTTGLPPLDDAIRTALKVGWTHHIVRLMVIANVMTLAEIAPAEAHRWFMELYVDSADWVMGPNVYGMGIFSDGGVFATKPYICASSYLLKMSDYGRGEWCDVLDGLYWRFVAKHRAFFAAQPRLAVLASGLERLAADRKERIFAAAEGFLVRCTRTDSQARAPRG